MSETAFIRRLTGQQSLEDARRRAFIQTSAAFAAVIGVYAIVMNFVLPGFPLGNWIGAVAAAAYLTFGLIASRTQTITAPASAFVAVGILSVLASAVISGGVDDFTTPFFIIVPAIAGYFLGARGAFFSGLATIAAIFFLASLDMAGRIVDTPYSSREFEIAATVVLVTSIAMTMLTANLFARRAAEHAARIEENNQLLSAFARTAPVAIAMFDRKMRHIEVSDRWLAEHGLARDNIVGRSLYELFPDMPQDWKDVHQRCLAGATERREEDRYQHPDGSIRWMNWEVRPWREAKGAVGGLVVITRDITDQVRAREELAAAKRAAEEAAQANSAFLAAMSHEIRTPLNAVIGLTDALLDTPLNERQHRLLGEANRAGSHLLTLISDILDLSKLDAGKMEFDPSPFSLRGLVAGVEGMFSSAAERKGVALETRVAPDAPGRVVADENRIRQILINLVGNALKFTADGRIDLAARTETKDGELRLVFTVADSGVGIAEERMPFLFDAFAQAAPSISREFGGTGLGLAISQKLAREMRGAITCESVLGRGSTFRLVIPARSAPANTGAPPVVPIASGEGALAGFSVLFADDNAGNRLVHEEYARALGCAFVVAASGREAIDACASGNFDAVVMDMEMPGMDGAAATKAIRALPGCADMPVIAATAHALSGDRERFLAAGLSGYLAKPLSRRGIAEAILGAIGDVSGESEQGKSAGGPVDPAVIFELLSTTGAEQGRALYEDLWRHLEQSIDALAAAGEKADADETRRLAHAACGLAGNIGATALAGALRAIEYGARDGQAVESRIGALAPLRDESKRSLDACIKRLKAS